MAYMLKTTKFCEEIKEDLNKQKDIFMDCIHGLKDPTS